MYGSAIRSSGFFFLTILLSPCSGRHGEMKNHRRSDFAVPMILIMKDSALWVLYDGLPCDTARVCLSRRITCNIHE